MPMSRAERRDYDHRMEAFADIGENSVVDLVTALLLMAAWGGAILAIDYWVWSDQWWPKRPSAQSKVGR
jgi:hypothetical protein